MAENDGTTIGCSERVGLTRVQQDIWTDEFVHPERNYQIGVVVELRGSLDIPRLCTAVRATAERIDALRLVLDLTDTGVPRQRFLASAACDIDIEVVDVRADSEAAVRCRIDEYFSVKAKPNDLLWQMMLLKLADKHHLWVQRYHHLMADGYSFCLLNRAFAAHYSGTGAGDGLEASSSYQEYLAEDAEYRDSPQQASDLEYWQRHLSGREAALFAPSVGPAASTGRVYLKLPRSLAGALLAAGGAAAPPFSMIALVALILARLNDRKNLTLGLLTHNRTSRRARERVGMHSSVMPLAVDIDRQHCFADLVSAIAGEIRASARHQRSTVSEIHACLRGHGVNTPALFDVALSLENFPADISLGDILLRAHSFHRGPMNAPLTMVIGDYHADQDLSVEIHFDPKRVPLALIEQICACLPFVLAGLQVDSAMPIGRIPLLSAAGRSRVLHQFNATKAAEADVCVHRAIEAQAHATPSRIAASCGSQKLTYRELNQGANRLAHRLRTLGVQRDVRVGLHLERNLDMLVAMLAVLKAGGAYMPLDPEFPLERRKYMLADSSAPLVLVSEDLPALDVPGVTALTPAAGDDALNALPATNLTVDEDPTQLAYVLYTSGSTGKPKGVMVEHRQLHNFLRSMREEPGLTADDRVLATTTLSFDIAGLELWLPLICGAQVVIGSRRLLADPFALMETLQSASITVLQATPTAWRMLLEAGWEGHAGLTALCGGEALSPDLAERLLPKVGSLWNLYGPTETTIWSTLERVTSVGEGSRAQSIGRPIANTRVYILDACREPVPIDVTGELYVAGAGVARGYLNRDTLTTERFLPDPFCDAPGARMYRTGDFAAWDKDGRLHFFGRKDHQVKLRGHRLEPGEIEIRLREYPSVTDAVVIVREDNPGDQRLVGYFSARSPVTDAQLAEHLQRSLPGYMIPSDFVALAELPRTANGKLDRNALPAPTTNSRKGADAVGSVEQTVAAIWERLLKVPHVLREDHFFELGGHSLLANRMILSVRETLGLTARLHDLFEHPTLQAFVERLTPVRRFAPVQPRTDRATRVPVTVAQREFWLAHHLEGSGASYNIPGALRITGALDTAVLEQALTALVARHEALRTRFEFDGEQQMVQVIEPAGAFDLQQRDVSALPCAERDQAVDICFSQEAARVFDLSASPLTRGILLRLGAEEHVLLLTVHHIAADGWSLSVLLNDLVREYEKACRGGEDEASSLQFLDWRAAEDDWLETPEAEEQANYWREQLEAPPSPLMLPLDRDAPERRTFDADELRFALTPAGHAELHAFAREQNLTAYMVFLGALAVLAHRLSGQEDFLIAAPFANRRRGQSEAIVGPLMQVLPLRMRLHPEMSIAVLLEHVRTAVLEAQENQELPSETITSGAREACVHGQSLYSLQCVLQNMPAMPTRMTGLALIQMDKPLPFARYDLSVVIHESTNDFEVRLNFATELLTRETIERWAVHLQTILRAVLSDTTQLVEAVPLMPEEDLARPIVTYAGR